MANGGGYLTLKFTKREGAHFIAKVIGALNTDIQFIRLCLLKNPDAVFYDILNNSLAYTVYNRMTDFNKAVIIRHLAPDSRQFLLTNTKQSLKVIQWYKQLIKEGKNDND